MGARAAVAAKAAFFATATTNALFLGTGCQPLSAPNDAVSNTPAANQSAARVTDAATTARPARDAQAWWKRTQEAQRTVPVRASVVVTRFHEGGAPPTISRYDMVEGRGGRKYRITYHAPQSASGRIVLCDGVTIWQYEPNQDMVLRRPAPILTSGSLSAVAVETGATDGDAADGVRKSADTLPETGGALRLEPDADSVAGRPTRVLDLLSTPNGAVVERRWIDTQTGRALRTERYDVRGKPWRRVEMTQVEFSPTVPNNEFVALIANGTPVIDTDHPALRNRRKPRRDAEAAARRVHLAVRARDFVLEAVTKHSVLPGGKNGAGGTTHLTYTNGTAAISVFVTPVGKSGGVVLQAASGWKPATFPAQNGKASRPAWTQETPTQSAVAWTQNHDRLIAVAQMPARHLLPLVGTLALGTQDNEKPVHIGKTPDK